MQIKMKKATDIFKEPYTTDGVYIYDSNNQMCLMAGDCANYPEEMLARICEILNGTKPTKGNPGVAFEGPEIYLNGDLILVEVEAGAISPAPAVCISERKKPRGYRASSPNSS